MNERPAVALQHSVAGSVQPESRPLKRVLMLSNCNPFPPTNGIALRVWAILQVLSASGHDIELLCFGDPGKDKNSEICKSVQVFPQPKGGNNTTALLRRAAAILSAEPYAVVRSRSKRMAGAILDRLRRHACDAIICEETDLLVNVPRTVPVPLIIDHHNAEHVLLERYLAQETNPFRRAYIRMEALKVRKWARNVTLRADSVMVCSDVDRRTYLRLCPSALIIVAPNVIDIGAYTPANDEEPDTILYAGGMDWYPNRDAVDFFVRSILPQIRQIAPQVKFVIAGRNAAPDFRRRFAGIPSIEFTGTVPDIRPYIGRATVCVVPLRVGSGTRLKIIEAAAMGKPIVSTSVGAEGLNFVNGEEIIIADDPLTFARATADFLKNEVHRNRVGVAARRRVESDYTLRALVEAIPRALANGAARIIRTSVSCGD